MADRNTSAAEYHRRMTRVLDHIDRHIAEPLELADLAAVAHFSPYHFHRLFLAWMGETLGDYLRRRRLEKGALMLAHQPEQAVLNIALTVGFGSGEAFARAFQRQFGCTPSAWRDGAAQRWTEQLAAVRQQRRERNPDQAESNPDQANAVDSAENTDLPLLFQESAMEVTILELPAATIAYRRLIGPYGPGIGEFWRSEFLPWLRANGLAGRICYGIGHDDPSLTPAAKCRYDACVEVDNGFTVTGRTLLGHLPGGRYAVGRFRGRAERIGDFWVEMFREWLPASGYQYDARPCFERYRGKADNEAEDGVFEADICIPVRPL